MSDKLGVFLLTYIPSWIGNRDILRYLPTHGVIKYAALRCTIMFASNDLTSKLCRQMNCHPPELINAIRDVVRRYEEIHISRRVDERFIHEFLSSVDRIVERYENTECGSIESLGCYLSHAPPDLEEYEDLVGKPLIVVNTEKISEVVDKALSDIGELSKFYNGEDIKRELLRSVIAHEVTHSYSDLAHDDAPKRRLSEYKVKFYYKVIEESLATYYELREFINNKTINNYIMYKLLQKSTIEYKAGLIWYHHSRYYNNVDRVLNSWVGFTNYYTIYPDIIVRIPISYVIERLIEHYYSYSSDLIWRLIAIALIYRIPKEPYVFVA